MPRLLLAPALLVAVAGCGSRPVPDLPDDPAEVTVLSVDGAAIHRQMHKARERELEGLGPDPDQAKVETHLGYPVIGRARVTDPGERRAVVAAVRSAIRDGPPQAARCFIPRHVVHADGVDVVICFECWRYVVYRNGEREEGSERTISPAAQPYFDKLLTAAGVPLAPK